jgi:hypothetical protein
VNRTTRERARLLTVLLVGLLAPGVARWWLGTQGAECLGTAVFAGGYGLTLLLVWQRWLRGTAFVGPEG